MKTPIAWYLVVSGLLFTIGTVGVLVRRNALVIFMSIELQLNAVNLALVAFSRRMGERDRTGAGLLLDDGGGGRGRRRPGDHRGRCTGSAHSINVDDASLLRW